MIITLVSFTEILYLNSFNASLIFFDNELEHAKKFTSEVNLKAGMQMEFHYLNVNIESLVSVRWLSFKTNFVDFLVNS